MIARQRDNLNRTFVQAEKQTIDAAAVRRLAKTESELAQATAEFTEGLEQRAGPVPSLHEALEAMQAATGALEQQAVKPARGSEETALAALIKVRQDMRKFLSQNSECASACRQFDNQQQQKLRKPPPKD